MSRIQTKIDAVEVRIEQLEKKIEELEERIGLLETMHEIEVPVMPWIEPPPFYDMQGTQPICYCGKSTVCPIHGVTSGIVASG